MANRVDVSTWVNWFEKEEQQRYEQFRRAADSLQAILKGMDRHFDQGQRKNAAMNDYREVKEILERAQSPPSGKGSTMGEYELSEALETWQRSNQQYAMAQNEVIRRMEKAALVLYPSLALFPPRSVVV